MMFVNSIKLFGSNWTKVLKFLLFYVVIWGLCFVLFLPVFFEFRSIVAVDFQSASLFDCFVGVFNGGLGQNIFNIIQTAVAICVDVFEANLGLAIYGLVISFVFLPRVYSLAGICASACDAKHLQIQCSVIWAASPNSKEEPRVYSLAGICASACDAKHLQIQRSVIWAASPNSKESHMDSKTASGQASTQLPGVMKR